MPPALVLKALLLAFGSDDGDCDVGGSGVGLGTNAADPSSNLGGGTMSALVEVVLVRPSRAPLAPSILMRGYR
jgi:hypothetical protein